nr:MAG TPA: minor tail protein [Caudoviricetes sp.]
MEEYNISLTNSDGTAKPFIEVLGDLRQAFSNLDEVQQAELATTIAGKLNMAGLLAIVNAGEEDFNKLANAIADSENASAEMAETMRSSAANQIEGMKSKISEMAISIGEKLLPTVLTIVEKIGEWVDKFNSLDSESQQTIITMGLFVAAISPIAGILGNVCLGISKAITMFADMSSVITGSGGVLGALSNLTSGLSPLFAGGVAVAAVVGGGAVLKKTFETIYEVGKWSSEGVSSFSEYYREFGKGVEEATNKVSDLGKELEDFAGRVLDITKLAISENRKLTDEEYQSSLSSLQSHHNQVIEELTNNKLRSQELVEAKYETELAIAKEKDNAKYEALKRQMEREIEAVNSNWDEKISIENQGYEKTLSDLEMSLEDQYASDSFWQEKRLENYNQYFDNAQVLLGTGLQFERAEYQTHYGDLDKQFKDFASSSYEEQQSSFNNLAQLAKDARDEELRLAEADYQAKLEKYSTYTEQQFEDAGMSSQELYDMLKTEYQRQNDEINQKYVDRNGIINDAMTRSSEIQALAFEAMNEANRNHLITEETDTNKFMNKIVSYYQNGGSDMQEAIDYALGNVKVDFEQMKSKISTTTSDSIMSMDRMQEKLDTQFRDRSMNLNVDFTETGYNNVSRKINSIWDTARNALSTVGSAITSGMKLGRSVGDTTPYNTTSNSEYSPYVSRSLSPEVASVTAYSSRAISPYATRDAIASQAISNAVYNYNTTTKGIKPNNNHLNTQSNEQQNRPIEINLNIGTFENNRSQDVQQLMKEISYYMNQQQKF